MTDELVVNESIGTDESAMDRIETIRQLPDVEKIVCLNDLTRGTHETPLSTAIATKETIYPELTAEVINCGFSLLRTDLKRHDITGDFVSELCLSIEKHSRELRPNREDVEGMLLHGAEYVVDNYECDPDVLQHIENNGNMFEPDARPNTTNEFVPPWLLRYDGIYEKTPLPHLRGNHFIEFQTVESIADEATANDWGLSSGDVVIFLHGDYLLTYLLFLHYTNREKFRRVTTAIDRGKLKLSKGLFHLYRGELRNFRQEWSLYTNEGTYTGFDENSPEGEVLAKVLKAGMNFGYANRLLTAICLKRAIAEVQNEPTAVDLLWDVGHDTIQKEQIGEENYWVHRKGVGKAIPGQPALITGSYKLNSFLGKGLPSGQSHLNSYDHGSRSVVEYFEDRGEVTELEETTRMYDYNEGTLRKEEKHIDPKPMEQITDNLYSNGIVSPVAWLKPFANISEY